MRQSQATAGETARSLQEIARLFAGEIEHLTPYKPHLAPFIDDAKALVPCLYEVARFLADEGDTPVRGHDQWLYEIDTALLLLDQVADARAHECEHVVDIYMRAVEAMINDVVAYANLKLFVPVELPHKRYEERAVEEREKTTIH